ncbi:MAG: RNA helicase domain-containing protein [Coriobacteriaceae bacterium]|nr:RNA helicase domain-containing protein [Coriobacteriaceae bacterium]MCI7438437.1 RNA helicase domain-containing protein [Coriobacteriaceae bacterium]MDY4534589.1 hypothetical protein [Tractidigestivibacter sp.]
MPLIDSTPQTASYYAVRQSNPDVYLPDLVPDGLDADALVGLVREHVEDDWSVPEVEEGPRFRFASRLGLDVPQVRLAVRFLENVVGYWLSSCRKPEARSASACLECSFGEPSEPRDADPDVIADRKRAGVNLHMHLCLTASGATSSRSVNFRQVQGAFPHAHIDPPMRLGTRDRFRHYVRKDTPSDYEKWLTSIVWVELTSFPNEEPAKISKPLERAKALIDEGMTPDEIRASGIEYNSLTNSRAIDSYFLARRRAEVVECDPSQSREVDCVWRFGEPGTSKTYTSMSHLIGAYGAEKVFKADGLRNAFDTYAGQPHVLLNDLAPERGVVKSVLAMCDPYPYQIPCRYQDRPLCACGHDAITITSTLDPWEWMVALPENHGRGDGSWAEPPMQMARRMGEVVYHFVADESIPVDDPRRYAAVSTRDLGVTPRELAAQDHGFDALRAAAEELVPEGDALRLQVPAGVE